MLSRFREAKTAAEEVNLVRNAVPKSTQYKNKWAHGIFEEWQRQRLVKVPVVEVAGLFETYDFHQVESLDTPLVEMSQMMSQCCPLIIGSPNSSRRLQSHPKNVSKALYIYFAQLVLDVLYLPFGINKACLFT